MNHLKKAWLKPVVAAAVLAMAVSLAPKVLAQGTGAEKKTSVGYLRCDVSDGWGIIFGSSKDIHCVFTPTTGYPEYYSGDINKYGADIGYTRSAVMLWGVLAPQQNLGRGALAGHYAGATGGATVGLGAAMHVLVGGLHNSIALQPILIQGNTGLNVAAGVATLNLHWDVSHEIGPGKPKP